MSNEATIIWLKNPLILFNKEQIKYLWPRENMSRNEKINAVSRLVIILSILGYLIMKNVNFLFTGLITLGIIAILYYTKLYKDKEDFSKKTVEPFTNTRVYQNVKDNFTNPTEKNPLMNVLIPEIKDNPKRKMAAPAYNPAVEKNINEKTEEFIVSNFDDDPKIKKKLFSNLGDSFEFEQFAQHNFYATPNTQIPNNQKEFAEFCYGDMISAKEGNDYALIRNNPRIGAVAGQN
jgi:hypothetical protein